MNNLKGLYTLVIPTYNRPDYLSDLLGYLAKKDAQFPILVLDSSQTDFREKNEGAVLDSHLNAKIVFFDSSVHPYDKLSQGLATVDSPFVQICADDDLVVPEKIFDCVDYLQRHPDFTVAHGRYLNVQLARGNSVYLQWEQYVPLNFESDDPAQRLGGFLEKYAALFYGVFRTSQLQRWMKESAQLESYYFKELFLSIMPVIEGKIARIEDITNLRFAGQPASAIERWQPTLWILDDFSEFWQHYERFREFCLNTCAERQVPFPQEKLGKQIFDTSMFYFMKTLVPSHGVAQALSSLKPKSEKKPESQKGPPPIQLGRILKNALLERRIYYPLALSTTDNPIVFDGYLKLKMIPRLESLRPEYDHFVKRSDAQTTTPRRRLLAKIRFAFPSLRAFGRAVMTIRQGVRVLRKGLDQKRLQRKAIDVTVRALGKLNIQFVGINIDRIGHLASEYDCHIKAERLGLKPRSLQIIYPPGPQKPANSALFKYLKSYAPVVTNRFLYKFLGPIAKHPRLFFDTYDYMVALNESSFYFSEVLPKWGARPPIVEVSKNDHRRAESLLGRLGLGKDDWYVCVHARTEDFAPAEDQHYRNTDIKTLDLAIDAIIRRGGICIRMGDDRMPRISERAGLIDYAHSPLRDPFLDFYLSATNRFFLGSCSGLASIPVLFGKPVVSVNMSPMSHSLAYTFRDINLPKLVWSERLERPMTFAEVMNSPIANFRYGSQYRDARVSVIDNTPEEIRDAVNEMMDRLDGRPTVSAEDDQLQNKFRGLFKNGHYTWSGQGRVGRDFLSKHRRLLADPQEPSLGPVSDRSL